MNAVSSYLQERFLDADSFARACGVSTETLARWIAQGLVPAPAYRVDASGTMHSAVFGAREAQAPEGQWFNPHATAWVRRVRHALATCGDDPMTTAQLLRSGFREHYLRALRDLHVSEGPIPGLVTAVQEFDEAAFDTQFPDVWHHFLAGTYGLCVARPTDEAHIAEKEVTQLRLTAATDNGTRRVYSADEAAVVRRLIARYVDVSMPFSPVEYASSSRKRLVEDVLIRLNHSL